MSAQPNQTNTFSIQLFFGIKNVDYFLYPIAQILFFLKYKKEMHLNCKIMHL